MLQHYFPYGHAKDIYSIDYSQLRDQGYKALIFDVDNTLVYHGTPVTREIEEFFEQLHQEGFKTLLLSNNSDERLEEFNQNIGTLYVAMADKPKPHKYLEALEKLGVEKNQAVVIGDQIFTDILGANRAGIPNILVDFIRLPEERKFGKKRVIEQLILKFSRTTGILHNRINTAQK